MTMLPLTPEHLRFSTAILWAVAGFGAYFFLSRNPDFSRRFSGMCRILDHQGTQVLSQRMLGFLFLGAISLLIILLLPQAGIKDYGLSFRFLSAPPWWSYLLIPLILLLSYLAAPNPGNLENYPQIRAKVWTRSMLILSAASWIIFLIGYEFLFRGFVLYASLELLEPVPAIALNCALYAFAHFYKGPGETFGSIPAGIILCCLTLITGNIWSAVLLHSLMALSNEWFSLKVHPDMSIKGGA
ncbi:MAG: CPBP family intramembrane metalloprotease [Bacteroidales bacterium]|nr:CPBP family intramembrane metalloprotease [Bacteroidales bacterium]